jgi:hypothetical protein
MGIAEEGISMSDESKRKAGLPVIKGKGLFLQAIPFLLTAPPIFMVSD